MTWSALWDDVYNESHTLAINPNSHNSSIIKQIAKKVRRTNGQIQEIVRELANGNVTAVTLSADKVRITHSDNSEFGGSRTTETVDPLNVTGVYATHGHPLRDNIDVAMLTSTDLSGNGGGSKAGDI